VGEFFKVVGDFLAHGVKNLYTTLVPSRVATAARAACTVST